MVSIIIPAYNAGPWILESINSVLGQTMRDLEIILVDDGSTDRTVAIVETIRDERLRVVRQSNKGQSAALNRGYADAKGEYIKILDADDWINPGHIQAQFEAIAGFPDCVASCRWGCFLHSPHRARFRSEHADRDYDQPIEWLVDSLTRDEGMMAGWRWLIPRGIWERAGGWNERLSLNNDFDFSIRLLRASGGVRFAAGATYAYRKGSPASISAGRDARAMSSAFLTTELGCRTLLTWESSSRIRAVCADRWQAWLHEFYPEYPELAELANQEVHRYGGSKLPLKGGIVMRCFLPLIGWRRMRRLQVLARRLGWSVVLRWKAARRLRHLAEARETNARGV